MWRRISQIASALIINSHWPSLFARTIYNGKLKGFCVPGLNCYSCPLAIFSCPIGSLQNVLAQIRPSLAVGKYYLGFYVIGLLGFVGGVVGRMPCGWICPFGALQDLTYKIPTPKLEIPRFLNYFKYIILLVMVILLPLLVIDALGYGQPWFCKYLCPAGTLEAGIPLTTLDSSLRQLIGIQFWLKIAILVFFLVIMIPTKRPFCRTVCPLGAIYSLFNRISLFRMAVSDKCIKCNRCYKTCPMSIKIYLNPQHKDCIRCLECINVCPVDAISSEINGKTIHTRKSSR
ncbi:4Fe-4S binding protein [Candidatus Poribacteria bacterium]|nr:4Fe-4S binding protein [Candidatus Poribacteria bacterium]